MLITRNLAAEMLAPIVAVFEEGSLNLDILIMQRLFADD